MTQRRAGLLQIVRIVLSAFFGVRRKSSHEEDAASLNPLHVIIVGVVFVAIFVLSLVLLVHFITA